MDTEEHPNNGAHTVVTTEQRVPVRDRRQASRGRLEANVPRVMPRPNGCLSAMITTHTRVHHGSKLQSLNTETHDGTRMNTGVPQTQTRFGPNETTAVWLDLTTGRPRPKTHHTRRIQPVHPTNRSRLTSIRLDSKNYSRVHVRSI
jgi:hypothetical protein